MNWIHPVYLTEEQLLAECRVSFSRASGPGGQHRNKVETSVAMEHLPSGIIGQASERRTQILNRKAAIHRLRLNLAVQWSPNRTEAIETTSANDPETDLLVTSRYRTNGRVEISESNWEFPIVLYESMNTLKECDWNLPKTSEQLSISSSQLIRLLKKHPAAFLRLNEERESLGLLKLK